MWKNVKIVFSILYAFTMWCGPIENNKMQVSDEWQQNTINLHKICFISSKLKVMKAITEDFVLEESRFNQLWLLNFHYAKTLWQKHCWSAEVYVN